MRPHACGRMHTRACTCTRAPTLDSRGMIACSDSPGRAAWTVSPCDALPCMMASTKPRGQVVTGDNSSE
jgi:hypothetical protein